ncbi:MAG: nucleoside-diphosphate sugar epimerase/dehydratase [Thermoanaerobaculia bacterium]
MEIFDGLLKKTRTKKYLFFTLGDVFLIFLSLFLSYTVRFEFQLKRSWEVDFLLWFPIFILIKLFFLNIFGLYNITWAFVGIRELANILKAMFFSSSILYFLNVYLKYVVQNVYVPRSILLMDFFLSVLFISFFRVSKRFYYEIVKTQPQGKPTLIIGAGSTGERLVREFIRSEERHYFPIGFLDDSEDKQGTKIHGIPVLGKISDLNRVLEENEVKTAIIAITTINHIRLKEIFESLSEAGIEEIKVVPHITKLPEHAVSVRDIQDIKIEDLLYREPVQIEETRIQEFLMEKRVLITGAGGSIGSEIVRQVLKFSPEKVICLDIDETEIFNLLNSLKKSLNTLIIPYVADIREKRAVEKLFQEHKPEVVFHSAAYKHVPMMEYFPQEAIKTNIFGTYNLGKLALEYKVERFINISTDKAVNPTSVMGATKRFAEMLCTSLNKQNSTKFISVRFGNVLASRGSVVPVFLEQIKKGGPVTVTHKDMKRYFMTIPEAVILVFQAAAMGEGGEVFVLDMGKPVSILKLAEDLIRINRLKPYEDIQIEFTGLRPGEKLYEELLTAEEGTTKTTHQKVFRAKNESHFDGKELQKILKEFEESLEENSLKIKNLIKKYVPYYKPHI